jgi:hypothetical protein
MSSWFSPKVEKRTSPIEGRGLFARQAISDGEIVAVKGGAVMDSDALALIRNDVSPGDGRVAQPFGFRPHGSERAAFPHSAPPEGYPTRAKETSRG